jgi:hypothetical protein
VPPIRKKCPNPTKINNKKRHNHTDFKLPIVSEKYWSCKPKIRTNLKNFRENVITISLIPKTDI